MFSLSIAQLSPGNDKKANLAKARLMIDQAAKDADMVVLPEMFNCPYQSDLFASFAESWPSGGTLAMLAGAARENGVVLVGGSIPELDGDRIYNTCFVFGPDGSLLGRHRKMHLFDVRLAGGVNFQESATLTAGDEVTVLDTGKITLGLAICYDMRFPELFRLLALQGAQLVVVPGNFNLVTGPAHWDLLARTRAVDNQVFVAAASCARDPGAPYISYGHSLVVDPWGTVLAQAGEGEEILRVVLPLEELSRIRASLPLLQHRRTDLYGAFFAQLNRRKENSHGY
ncbi:MAG TPA: carbon-nitrogen hydrolase family protein [Spirochaetia bacterium]|nr:carbon-nitrogen hydrolase family protein [Spirochaetia bacterium]